MVGAQELMYEVVAWDYHQSKQVNLHHCHQNRLKNQNVPGRITLTYILASVSQQTFLKWMEGVLQVMRRVLQIVDCVSQSISIVLQVCMHRVILVVNPISTRCLFLGIIITGVVLQDGISQHKHDSPVCPMKIPLQQLKQAILVVQPRQQHKMVAIY
jgi:hypothetical protein